ncbi:MAG: hypothetical protein O7E52_13140 [Candidatus Poribacteria bacterium]|nr:hypothetical protein [Candidatus Poribacteria bacterium]
MTKIRKNQKAHEDQHARQRLVAQYRHETENELSDSVVKALSLAIGSVEEKDGIECQWIRLSATKANDEKFSVWLLSENYPSQDLVVARKTTARYILQEGDAQPVEFRDRFTGKAVLPQLGEWKYLFPRPTEDTSDEDEIFPQTAKYLGHTYLLKSLEASGGFAEPPNVMLLSLRADVLIGPASNTRQKDETRRYDRSDYELVRLTEDDYNEMIDAGVNCLRVDAQQAKWIDRRNVFYWGIGGEDVSYPVCLYQSNYLGPTIFMDEPAVCTRDHVIRPRLREDDKFRKTITPQVVLEEFQNYFRKAKYEAAPTRLLKGLSARPDVDLGDMEFLQQNIYVWETMVSSAAYQLTEGNGRSPYAMVFEPPGRVGTMRTLPEMNMTYGCQIPVDNPKNLTSIIYGFLRGAARLSDKSWGMSIYGQVHRADAFWFQTHAYDLGARHFHYWDNYELACVPYSECLALSRNLSAHVESHPYRDLKALREAGEIAILLPPGYNLGHVEMGRGNLWGVGELNLERLNREGVKYRTVMSYFFTEIERAIRLGVAFDLIWDLDGLDLSGYREVVRIREDGKVEVHFDGKQTLHKSARTPIRPNGIPPQLTVDLSTAQGKAPLEITACATIVKGWGSIYYTRGADETGIYNNEMVLWELFGPAEEDYRFLNGERPKARFDGEARIYTVEIDFNIERPGTYRLRAATVDMAGRTAVVWKTVNVTN